jgi:hypothetical protein
MSSPLIEICVEGIDGLAAAQAEAPTVSNSAPACSKVG